MAKRVIVQNTRKIVKQPIKEHKQIAIEIIRNLKQRPVDKKVVIQNAKRELPRLPSFSSPNLITQIQSFIHDPNKHYYLGFGGLGDALLLMAVCWNDPEAKVVFFANQISFIREFFELFGIAVYLHDNIMGSPMANHIYNLIKKLPNFRQSAHLADNLDYNDWKNGKYKTRIKSNTTWIQHLGKEQFNQPVIIIAPSGSNKDIKRQRYININEYNQLVNLYLNKGYRVYATGSINDLHYFGLIDKENFFWLCSNKVYRGNGESEDIGLKKMLRIINSAEHIISVDTWLKTYGLLCGIPTEVIKTRWDGKYISYGEDITDFIFLNQDIWSNIKLITIEELLAS